MAAVGERCADDRTCHLAVPRQPLENEHIEGKSAYGGGVCAAGTLIDVTATLEPLPVTNT